ncbi:MAG: substrate-binding domain-containing protein [Oscillospiraceae bacterium]
MKKLLALLLAFIMALGMSACGGTGTKDGESINKEEPLKIGICVGAWTSNPIFIDAGNNLRAIAKENGYELYEKDLTTDTVVTTLENFISIGCDIVLVQANQAPDAVASLMPRFKEAGITLAIYDSDAFKDEPCVAYSATCSNYDAGYALGKAAAEWANKNIDGHVYAGVINRESNETFRFRAVGISDALKKFLTDGEVSASVESVPGNNEGGMKAAEDLRAAVPNMNLCIAWNGGAGVGAYEALKAANWNGALFTCDCSQDEVKALLDKNILIGSLDLDLGNQFEILLTKTIDYVKNGCKYPEGATDADKCWFYPVTLVTQETAKDYLLG